MIKTEEQSDFCPGQSVKTELAYFHEDTQDEEFYKLEIHCGNSWIFLKNAFGSYHDISPVPRLDTNLR